MRLSLCGFAAFASGLLPLVTIATGCAHAEDNYHPTAPSPYLPTSSPINDPGGSAAVYGGLAGAAATVEGSKDPKERKVLGWGFKDDGMKARWSGCTSVDVCTTEARTAPSGAVRGLHVVGRTRPTRPDQVPTDEVDVYEIRLHDTPAPPIDLRNPR